MRGLLCITLWLMIAGVPARGNLVQNPGFDLGSAVAQGQPILSWSSHSTAGSFGWGVGNANVHSAPFAAVTGCSGQACLDPVNGTTLFQSLATATGQSYTLTFWYDSRVQGSGPSSGTNFTELDVYWNGALQLSLPNVAPGYTQHTISGLLATGSATVLQFNGRNDPILGWLDDVSVEADTTATPESNTLLFTGIGLVAITIFRIKR